MKKSIILLLFILFTHLTYSLENKNEIGLFLGPKYITKTDLVKPSLGLLYEYKFDNTKPVIGIGAIGDITLNKKIEINGSIALFIHANENLKFFIAPGVYYVNYGVAPIDSNISFIDLKQNWGSQIRFLMQAGAQYDFKLDMIYLSPFIKFEKIDNEFRLFLGIGASYKL